MKTTTSNIVIIVVMTLGLQACSGGGGSSSSSSSTENDTQLSSMCKDTKQTLTVTLTHEDGSTTTATSDEKITAKSTDSVVIPIPSDVTVMLKQENKVSDATDDAIDAESSEASITSGENYTASLSDYSSGDAVHYYLCAGRLCYPICYTSKVEISIGE